MTPYAVGISKTPEGVKIPSIMRTARIVDFFFSSRRRHTRLTCDWSSDVCSSDLGLGFRGKEVPPAVPVLPLLLADQTQVRLVDQGGGLKIGRASCRERV